MTRQELKQAFGDSTDAVPYFPKVYLCNGRANGKCQKIACYMERIKSEYGQCKFTTNPENSKDGKTYIYDNGKYVEVK